MAHPVALISRLLLAERGELAVRRCDRVLALLRACGLRFRDGSRWRLPTMVQVHLI